MGRTTHTPLSFTLKLLRFKPSNFLHSVIVLVGSVAAGKSAYQSTWRHNIEVNLKYECHHSAVFSVLIRVLLQAFLSFVFAEIQ